MGLIVCEYVCVEQKSEYEKLRLFTCRNPSQTLIHTHTTHTHTRTHTHTHTNPHTHLHLTHIPKHTLSALDVSTLQLGPPMGLCVGETHWQSQEQEGAQVN